MRLASIMIVLLSCLVFVGCGKEESTTAPQQSSTPAPEPAEKPAVVQQAEEVVQQTREKVAEVAEQAQEKVAQVTEQAKEKVAEVKTQVGSMVTAAQDSLSAGSGEAVYSKSCSSCHQSGILGAPKTGDRSAWAPLIAGGMEQMVQYAINGKGKMPPRGGNSKLTDNEIQAAVEYMVEQSK